MENNKHKLITIDCGQNRATIYDGETVKTISHKEILSLPDKYDNCMIVGEDAHFGVPRSEKSLAQPFTKNQLVKFYNDCSSKNIKLRFFPQQSTRRAQLYAGLEKSDENDPKSIYKLIKDFPVQLKKPKDLNKETPYVRQEGWKAKDYTNKILNIARRLSYEDSNSKWLENNLEELASRLSPEAKDCFNLSDEYKYKIKAKKGDFKIKVNGGVSFYQLYSILSFIQGEIKATEEKFDILPNKRERKLDGSLPKWTFVKEHLLCSSPHHRKGGVARSNLYYHGLRNWIIKKGKLELDVNMKPKNRGQFSHEEEELYHHYRIVYAKSTREVFNVLRDLIQTRH